MEVTPENIESILRDLDYEARYEHTRSDWSRCYIMQSSNGTTEKIGAVLFLKGEFSHIKWADNPRRKEISEQDKLYCDLLSLQSGLDRVLCNAEWQEIMSKAQENPKYGSESPRVILSQLVETYTRFLVSEEKMHVTG